MDTTSEKLKGTVERITYYNAENGYTVLRLRPEQRLMFSGFDGTVTVVGTLPEIQPGEMVLFEGQWVQDKKYGRQFRAEGVQQAAPATLEGLRRYLGSGLIKGIGPVTARKIVAHFGMETLDVLDAEPDRLFEVEGVGPHRVRVIKKAWAEQQAIKEVMLFLQAHKVSTALAVKIYKAYGDEAIQKVQDDPYRLARDIWGIGFISADRIARDLGLAEDAPQRLAAGVIYALNEASNDGHVYVPRHELVKQAAELLGVSDENGIEAAVERLHVSEDVIIDALPSGDTAVENEAIYLPALYYAERGVVQRLRRMLDTPTSRLTDMRRVNWPYFLRSLQADARVELTDDQRRGAQMALTSKVSVLTGGPGVGKTTTLRTVIAALRQIGHRFLLCSPTGRAAKRLAETTDEPAQTIHRLLGFSPGEGFGYNEDNQLDTDMVVVDEASMIDLSLFYSLLRAIAPDTHLLLVGDVDQLPSVGAGDVLNDMIRSGVVPVTRLQIIFRQAQDSLIIGNAHRINQGQQPDTDNSGGDFFFFGVEEPEAVAAMTVDIVQNRVPGRFGYDPLDDVQVLVPMYRGPVGVHALNDALQLALNPPGHLAEHRLFGRLFRVGDKVMQTRNNYDKEVFNGDIGRVKMFDFEEQTIAVDIEGRTVHYDFAEADELVHAYAVSVHKSQGSEYPVVVLPLVTQHYMMLQRNLLYTAVTRARKLVVLVGTRKAIAIAVKNDQITRRYSALDWRLRQSL